MMRFNAIYLWGVCLFACRTANLEPEDQDGDGYSYIVDCNDLDASVFPGSAVHEDPNLCFMDTDGDGYGARNALSPYTAGSDCDDRDAAINPGRPEICDGIDQNCNDVIDEDLAFEMRYPDADADGFGTEEGGEWRCDSPPNHVNRSGDCNDNDPAVNPAAVEICDSGIDNDCNGKSDDTDPNLDLEGQSNWWLDYDGDGFGEIGEPIAACAAPEGYADTSNDCFDRGSLFGVAAQDIHPTAIEICDDVDNDCDGLIDDMDDSLDQNLAPKFYGDVDEDGYGDPNNWIAVCIPPGQGWVDNDQDCLDTGSAGGKDASEINPDAIEECDTIDNDCDQLIDDNDNSLDLTTAGIWYLDSDADGYGDPNQVAYKCIQPTTHVADNTDCLDSGQWYGFDAQTIHPNAVEQCDGFNVDNACDGPNDNGLVSFESQTGSWNRVIQLNGYATSGPGILHICEGQHAAQIDILHDIDVQSHGVVTLDGEESGSVIHVQSAAQVTLNELNIINGSGELWAGEWLGGGINCAVNTGAATAELTINYAQITGNSADSGSAVYTQNCNVAITNSVVAQNTLDSPHNGATVQVNNGSIHSENNDFKYNTGGLSTIEAIHSTAVFENDLFLGNTHQDSTMTVGGNGLYALGELENVQFIDNAYGGGAVFIRHGGELNATDIEFNSNGAFQAATDDVNHHMHPIASFHCAEKVSGSDSKLRCGTPTETFPQYSTHLNVHIADGIQFHSALMSIPADGSPNIDSFGLRSLETLILQCRTDFSLHEWNNGEWIELWSETIDHGNSIASPAPRILKSSPIDIPFSGGETLLFGAVISNCTGVRFESPQTTNTYGNQLIWDSAAQYGPDNLNHDRSFDPSSITNGLGGVHLGFHIHFTDE